MTLTAALLLPEKEVTRGKSEGHKRDFIENDLTLSYNPDFAVFNVILLLLRRLEAKWVRSLC